jgi:sulfatase maturation enzyme AslB (radical SAM superfamily)
MNYPLNVSRVSIELTDICQAACPMCARNWYGGAERNYITNREITLLQFKQWFPKEFLKTAEGFTACGNLGDPVAAKDCLEIAEYLIENTTDNFYLNIHTNGSLRSKEWWTSLGKIMKNKGIVVFAIDGFAGSHELYRKHTNFDKIIENAKAFIDAGGRARSDTIAFKHNEHELEKLEAYLLSLGFDSVNIKSTQRFHGISKYPVKNKDGVTEYYIEPPTISKYSEPIIKINMDRLVKPDVYKSLHDNAVINPECFQMKEVYIDCSGRIFPCCAVASTAMNDDYDGEGATYEMRNRLKESAMDVVDGIGILHLEGSNIIEQLANSGWFDGITHYTTVDKKLICIKACATNIRTLVEEKESNKEYVKFC